MRLLLLLALAAICRADVGRTVYFVRHGVRLPFVQLFSSRRLERHFLLSLAC